MFTAIMNCEYHTWTLVTNIFILLAVITKGTEMDNSVY
jgi:hypothetical protein